VVSFTPRLLYSQGKNPWYPFDRRLGGLRSQSEHGCEEKNSQLLPRLELPIIQPVVRRYITELSRLIQQLKSIVNYQGPIEKHVSLKTILTAGFISRASLLQNDSKAPSIHFRV
jgi:hypothetical protein